MKLGRMYGLAPSEVAGLSSFGELGMERVSGERASRSEDRKVDQVRETVMVCAVVAEGRSFWEDCFPGCPAFMSGCVSIAGVSAECK